MWHRSAASPFLAYRFQTFSFFLLATFSFLCLNPRSSTILVNSLQYHPYLIHISRSSYISAHQSTMTSQTPIHSQSQREVNLSPFNLLALPANMVYPPLPPINDERIYKMVTTHSSLYMDKKNSMNLDPKTMVEDYEKLEHVGDALLGTYS